MKIALVHDYIKEYGGAERVLEALHEVYPEAPVFTTVYLPKFLGPHRERFKDWDIRTSWFQNIPFKQKLISPLRLVAPFLFKQFNFSDYDVVIVSATGAYSPNCVNVKRKAKNEKQNIHVSYVHTPPRYLYGYKTAREWKENAFTKTVMNYLRKVDIESSKNVDYFIANSREVASRIKKFYDRDSIVVYPPVQVPSDKRKEISDKKDYYLAGGRLARPKHIDLIVRTCREHNLPLKVFGRGFAGYERELGIRNQESGNVEFLGEISDQEKYELMKGAKAFLFASQDEDFGITPVEAMALGTPVVAYRGGGVLESIAEEKTGVFFDELNSASMLSAIQKLDAIKFNSSDFEKVSEKFSKARFQKEIKEFVESSLKKR